jgi:hypothetical protein
MVVVMTLVGSVMLGALLAGGYLYLDALRCDFVERCEIEARWALYEMLEEEGINPRLPDSIALMDATLDTYPYSDRYYNLMAIKWEQLYPDLKARYELMAVAANDKASRNNAKAR